MKGQVISGEFGKIIIRQKSSEEIELGELLISETDGKKIILQVYDLQFGSQISQQNLELIAGMQLEDSVSDLEIMDKDLRIYNLALVKPILATDQSGARLCKLMPNFFSTVREITSDDLKFLSRPTSSIFLGNLRSGSKVLDVAISLNGIKVFTHHVLIPASTGKGKSNLTSVILWDQMDKNYCGILVLDPHDEYYGRNGLGMKDHPSKNIVYYSANPPPGGRTLKLNLKKIRPEHFHGAIYWTLPQVEALSAYFRTYKDDWVGAIVRDKKLPVDFHEGTIGVIKRRMLSLLNIEFDPQTSKIHCNGIFDTQAGETTISDICSELQNSKTVIIDTSAFPSNVEILIGSLISTEIFNTYRWLKSIDQLKDKPVISIVLEEAPRVLGKDVLERGPNIFGTIAREGRKFKVGLTAITQLPSLIPREILANMNTKIILGIEMAPERQAIIDSASQDLSTDNRNIASLDQGEAIVTSNFTKFAIPIKIPLFKEFAKKSEKEEFKQEFSGVQIS